LGSVHLNKEELRLLEEIPSGGLVIYLEYKKAFPLNRVLNDVIMKRSGFNNKRTFRKHLSSLEGAGLLGIDRTKRPSEITLRAQKVPPNITPSIDPHTPLSGGYSDLLSVRTGGSDDVIVNGDKEMFFEELKENPDYTQFDYKCSSILAAAVKERKLISTKYSLKKWSIHFRRLREVDGIKKIRIKNVLKWYKKNIGKKYTPQAFSAEGFRKKFLQIEAAAEKSAPVKVKQTNDGVKVYENIWDYSWENNETLKWCIEKSLNNYKQFLKELRSDFKNKKLTGFTRHLYTTLPPPVNFVENWFKDVTNWSNFNGRLDNITYTADSPRFTKYGRQVSVEFNGFTKTWDTLMEELNAD